MGAFPCLLAQWLLSISTHLLLRGQCREYCPCWADSPGSRFNIGTIVPLAPEAGGTLAGLEGIGKGVTRYRQARYSAAKPSVDNVMRALYDFTVNTLFADFL